MYIERVSVRMGGKNIRITFSGYTRLAPTRVNTGFSCSEREVDAISVVQPPFEMNDRVTRKDTREEFIVSSIFMQSDGTFEFLCNREGTGSYKFFLEDQIELTFEAVRVGSSSASASGASASNNQVIDLTTPNENPEAEGQNTPATGRANTNSSMDVDTDSKISAEQDLQKRLEESDANYAKLYAETEQLRQERQSLQETLENVKKCPVCFEPYSEEEGDPKQMIVCNNNHTVCEKCAQQMNTCPICRARIRRRTPVRFQNRVRIKF